MKKPMIKLLSLSLASSLLLSANVFAGTWHQQGTQWKYESDGSYAANNWIMDQNTWYHFDKDGMMQTGWILDGGSWYYLDSSGAMLANTSRSIDGVNYNFDSSGRWIESAQTVSGWNGNTFTNTDFNYSITFTDNFTSNSVDNATAHFSVETKNAIIMADGVEIPDYINIEEYMNTFYQEFLNEIQGSTQQVNKTSIQLGDYQFTKIHSTYENQLDVDLYWTYSDSKILCFAVACTPAAQSKVQQTLSSIKRLH